MVDQLTIPVYDDYLLPGGYHDNERFRRDISDAIKKWNECIQSVGDPARQTGKCVAITRNGYTIRCIE